MNEKYINKNNTVFDWCRQFSGASVPCSILFLSFFSRVPWLSFGHMVP